MFYFKKDPLVYFLKQMHTFEDNHQHFEMEITFLMVSEIIKLIQHDVHAWSDLLQLRFFQTEPERAGKSTFLIPYVSCC